MPKNSHAWMLLLSLLTFGCAASQTPDPIGGETHFLEGCEEGTCGLGLDCVCGVCTKACATDNSCGDLNSKATCEAAGTPTGACNSPIATPVCDVLCTTASDCSSLGGSYTCESGSCRKLTAGACINDGMVYSPAAVVADPCLICLCVGFDLYCQWRCVDGGMDSGVDGRMDGGHEADIDAQTTDADIDANVPILVDTGLLATPDPACDNGPVGVFTPKEMDPVPTCVEHDDLTTIPGSQIVAYSAHGVQTATQSDTEIFWVIGSDLYRVSKMGSDPRQFSGAIDARALLLDGCNLYIATSDFEGVLASTSITDGSYTTIARFPDASNSVSDIIGDSDNLYVFMDAALQRVPRTGGAIVTMADRNASRASGYDSPVLTADETQLYWLDGDSVDGRDLDRVMAMTKSGDTRPRVLASQLAHPIHIAWRDGFLYVLNDGTRDPLGNYEGDGGLVRVDPTSGTVTTLAEFSGATDLASDDQFLYWIRALPGGYSVSRVPVDQSDTPVTLFDNLRGNGRTLMVDDSYLYWQSECSGTGFSSTFIARVPKPAP